MKEFSKDTALTGVAEIYNVLVESSGRPDISVVRDVMEVCCAHKQPDKMLVTVMRDIERFDLRLDDRTIRVLASACEKARDARSARKLLERLREGRVIEGVKVASLQICKQLSQALISGGDLEGALSVLDAMKEWDVVPDERMYTVLLSRCERGRWRSRPGGGYEEREEGAYPHSQSTHLYRLSAWCYNDSLLYQTGRSRSSSDAL